MITGCLALLFAIAPRPVAAAPLGPADLLLVYNADLPASRELAEYYAKVRNIPAGRLCGLHGIPAADEEISAEAYENAIREPIRDFLTKQQLRDRVRCLVTFYGLPIRVRERTLTPADRLQLAAADRGLSAALLELADTVAGMEKTLNLAAATPASRPARIDPKDLPVWLNRYRAAASQTLQRFSASPQDTPANNGLLEALRKIEGDSRLLTLARAEPGTAAAAALEKVRDKQRQDMKQAETLLASNDPAARNDGRNILRKVHGLAALILNLNGEQERLRTDKSGAAVDSELMLLWWDTYVHAGMLPNPRCWRNMLDAGLHAKTTPGFWTLPVLFVSRLDAAGPATVRRMIDDAIAAEQKTPTGTVYIDSRGIPRQEGFGEYDQDLRDLWGVLKLDTKLPVRLDERPQLFGPKECPNTLLYCGWYSLRHYIDSFTFARGAVAYHIASFEAISLKKPGELGWCKNLLEHGAAATEGAVAEPFLQSFPRPKEFLGLLLTGQFTLVECYTYALPWTSWMQMLLGDPLYRPFASHPYLRVEQIFPKDRTPPEFGGTARLPTATAPAAPPAAVGATR